MAKIERSGEVQGKSATEVYEAAVTAFEEVGFEVWKKRPIAWLAMVRGTFEGLAFDGNLAARFTQPTSYILTLTSETMSDELLGKAADTFLGVLTEKLAA